MRRSQPRRLAAVVASLCSLVGTACGDAGPEILGFEVRVESPAGAEGAALVELLGPVMAVSPFGGELVETRSVGDTTWVVVAIDPPAPLRFRVRADVRPRARLLQVADGANRIRPDLRDYRVRVVP